MVIHSEVYGSCGFKIKTAEEAALKRAATKKDYDLMTLVVARLGHKVYNGEKRDEAMAAV